MTTSSKSEKTDIRRDVLLDNEQRHSIANVPMSLPKDAFQLVPGIFVASKDALPKLIEFFNVTHIVRCVETDAQEAKEDWLVTLGGSAKEPYGSSIPYPRNVFHCPLRDSIDEAEFIPWARRASDFIANTLHIEEDEEIVMAQNQAKREAANDDEDDKEGRDKEENKQDGGDDDGSGGRREQNHVDVNNDDDDQQQQQQQQNETNNDKSKEDDENENENEEQDDIWAAYRDRPAGAIVIHCEKGKSRSPAIALAYLMIKRQMTLEEGMDLFMNDEDEEENVETSDDNNNLIQINPVFIMDLAKIEAQVHGSPIFDLDAYWMQRLQRLFPKVPTATIAKTLSDCGGNMLAAREKLMVVAARRFFDRDALMVDALFNIVVKTVEDYRSGKDMRIPEGVDSAEKVVTKEECHKYYHENDKKRDVALMKLTQLVKERMKI